MKKKKQNKKTKYCNCIIDSFAFSLTERCVFKATVEQVVVILNIKV